MSTVNLKYGKTSIEIDLDGAKSIDTLVEKPMREIEDIEKEFRYSIEDGVIGALPLKDLIKSDDKVTVIISDLTRFWMRQDIICSLLVKYLREDMNIPTENIAVLIALGTHRKNTEEEKKTLTGEYAYNNCAEVVDLSLIHI